VTGFDSLWHALSWYQAAAIRTLGHVEAVVEPKRLMPEAGVMRHLLLPRETEDSAYVRRRLVEQMDDACDLAYRQFRERANERVDNDDSENYDDVDPDEERNPLMRRRSGSWTPARRVLSRRYGRGSRTEKPSAGGSDRWRR